MQFFAELRRCKVIETAVLYEVAGELALRLLGGDAPKARPTDPRAYSLCLQGRHFFSLLSASGFERAIPRSRARSPSIRASAPPGPRWVRSTGDRRTIRSFRTRRAHGGRAKRRRRALSFDPEQAEPMSLLGLLDVIEQHEGALGLRRIERALALEPHNQRVLSRSCWP